MYLELGMKLAARKMQKEIDSCNNILKSKSNSIELSS